MSRCEALLSKDYVRSRKIALDGDLRCRRIADFTDGEKSFCSEHMSLRLLLKAFRDGRIERVPRDKGEREYRFEPEPTPDRSGLIPYAGKETR